jgi:hypothetical protein
VVIYLWRKIIRFGFAELPDHLRVLIVVVYMVWQGAHVVEEFRVHRPAVVFFPETLTDEGAFQMVDRIS